MKIAIIGSGNIGSALAKGLAKKGHKITMGVRDANSKDIASLAGASANISAASI